MTTDPIIFNAKWLVIRESTRGFQYLERKGKDSVAVFLVRHNKTQPGQYEVLIRQQPLCIDNDDIDGTLRLFPCPITGAIEVGEAPDVAAVREVYEEAGYTTSMRSLGHYIVGTQTNEICYLYYADVTDAVPDEALQDGSYFESISRNEWHPFDYLQSCEYSACQIGYFKLKAILFSST